jgi:hypothetical protein
LKKEINIQEPSNIFSFPSFEYLSEDEMVQEEEIEHVVEEMPQIQEEENETTQIQEEVEEATEKIPLRRSNRIP